jgi:nucleotide-binding universal stress UspA family protein
VGSEAPPVRRFVARLAEWLGGEEEVTVLHVMSQLSAGPGVRGRQLRAGVDELVAGHTPEGQLIEQDVRVLDRPGLHPQAKVRHGLVVDEILSEARSGDYDLVIIGAHQENGWQRFLLDDLAHQILLHVDRNVLVVH